MPIWVELVKLKVVRREHLHIMIIFSIHSSDELAVERYNLSRVFTRFTASWLPPAPGDFTEPLCLITCVMPHPCLPEIGPSINDGIGQCPKEGREGVGTREQLRGES